MIQVTMFPWKSPSIDTSDATAVAASRLMRWLPRTLAIIWVLYTLGLLPLEYGEVRYILGYEVGLNGINFRTVVNHFIVRDVLSVLGNLAFCISILLVCYPRSWVFWLSSVTLHVARELACRATREPWLSGIVSWLESLCRS